MEVTPENLFLIITIGAYHPAAGLLSTPVSAQINGDTPGSLHLCAAALPCECMPGVPWVRSDVRRAYPPTEIREVMEPWQETEQAHNACNGSENSPDTDDAS